MRRTAGIKFNHMAAARCKLIALWLVVFCLSVATASIDAEQLGFEQSQTQNGMAFSFDWVDSSGQEKTLRFELSNEQIEAMPRNTQNYSAELAQQHVRRALIKKAREVDPREARVVVRRIGQELEISVRSRFPETLKQFSNELSQIRERALEDYLKDKNYTHFTTYDRQRAIKHDHVKYALDSAPHLRPLAEAMFEQVLRSGGKKDFIDAILSFVQSIPYDPLEDRKNSPAIGFLAPIDVLLKNVGDCDSKSVLAAAIYKSVFSTDTLAFVFLPEHALLGFDLRVQKGFETLSFNDNTYVLAEPTGPQLLPLGEIATSSRTDIGNRQYILETF